MFNVSALLLDDALKPATPLIAPLISGVAGLSASSSSKEDTEQSPPNFRPIFVAKRAKRLDGSRWYLVWR